jgi:Zn-finger nucleic acid-binding protein
MEKVTVGPRRQLEIDLCRRCGGIWLEKGEIQGLRAHKTGNTREQIVSRPRVQRVHCHECLGLMDRQADKCPECGWANVLDCPDCAGPMRMASHGGLRLDICQTCQGVWFDHDELESIWSPSFDRALEKRNLTRTEAVVGVADVGGDVLLNTLFFAPDLVYYGASAVGHVLSSSASAISHLPDAVGAAPEVAGGAIEAIGEATGKVFEVIVEIIAGIFG